MSDKEIQTIKRNDPCPCGSGLKYKKCCGIYATKGGCITLKKKPAKKPWEMVEDKEDKVKFDEIRTRAFR